MIKMDDGIRKMLQAVFPNIPSDSFKNIKRISPEAFKALQKKYEKTKMNGDEHGKRI